MSELNNTQESIDDGIPEVSFTLEVSNTQQTPVDTTLSISGMAADAKATGDAIAAAKTEVEGEIGQLETAIAAIAGDLFPVGAIYVSTSSTAPTFGANTWTWVEIMIPATWGDLEDGSRSYADKESGDTPGTLHFWRRTT